jgi:hypothetical protein
MASPVMGDAAVSMGGKEEHLVLERIRAQRPAMAEDHRLPRTPVVVVNLCAVLGSENAHGASFPKIRRLCRRRTPLLIAGVHKYSQYKDDRRINKTSRTIVEYLARMVNVGKPMAP